MTTHSTKQEAPAWGRLITLLVVFVPVLGLLYAIHQLWNREVNARDLVLCGILYALTALGICIGFHRLVTHRSFITFSPERALVLILGSMPVEAQVLTWSPTHLEHHARSNR